MAWPDCADGVVLYISQSISVMMSALEVLELLSAILKKITKLYHGKNVLNV